MAWFINTELIHLFIKNCNYSISVNYSINWLPSFSNTLFPKQFMFSWRSCLFLHQDRLWCPQICVTILLFQGHLSLLLERLGNWIFLLLFCFHRSPCYFVHELHQWMLLWRNMALFKFQTFPLRTLCTLWEVEEEMCKIKRKQSRSKLN